jgi:hypothetical protein
MFISNCLFMIWNDFNFSSIIKNLSYNNFWLWILFLTKSISSFNCFVLFLYKYPVLSLELFNSLSSVYCSLANSFNFLCTSNLQSLSYVFNLTESKQLLDFKSFVYLHDMFSISSLGIILFYLLINSWSSNFFWFSDELKSIDLMNLGVYELLYILLLYSFSL